MQRFKVNMTEGPPWKQLMLFTVPLLIGNLFQQVYGAVDAIMLGRYVGDNALAAVGSSFAFLFLVMVLMMGISVGVGIMVSQFYGANKREALSYTIGNGITLTAIIAIILMIVGPLSSRPLLTFLNTPPEILDDGVMYVNILLWGCLGLAYFNVLSGILRGLGDAMGPLLYLAIACLLNIIFNFVFIVILGLGVPSAALGTVMAQSISSILCLRRLLNMREVFDMGAYYLRLKKEFASQILRLGVPTGASHAIIALAVMTVQPLVNDFGPLFMATYVIVMKIDGFVMMPNFSFGNAMTVFAGQNMGAGQVERIAQGTRHCVILAVGTALVLVSIILIFGGNIAGVFTETQEVRDMSRQMLFILAPGYVAFAAAMVFWGTVRGAGDAISPLWGAAINSIVVRVPVAYLLVHLMGRPEALMYSLLMSWIANMLISVAVYKIGKWRSKGIVEDEPI